MLTLLGIVYMGLFGVSHVPCGGAVLPDVRAQVALDTHGPKYENGPPPPPRP